MQTGVLWLYETPCLRCRKHVRSHQNVKKNVVVIKFQATLYLKNNLAQLWNYLYCTLEKDTLCIAVKELFARNYHSILCYYTIGYRNLFKILFVIADIVYIIGWLFSSCFLWNWIWFIICFNAFELSQLNCES